MKSIKNDVTLLSHDFQDENHLALKILVLKEKFSE